ncbi:transglutaminase domain-containing protein [Candidatus Roizmanbacteria bacterium]|nr:transglutaminase domain-containing protein [Candidatus Roizmanbacteria bacterium]
MSFKKLISFLISLIFFLFLPSLALASSENFTTDYHVTYTILEDGKTHAQLSGTLTNTTSQYYASSYKMQLGFDNISNVKASDSEGTINPTVTKNDEGYVIGMTFKKKSVGLGSKLPFSISFDTPAIARPFGKIWEINIPGIANPEDFTSFTVSVVVPPSFGRPAYIKPAQTSKSLTFTKEQLGKSGISIAFGDEQLYNYFLTYHLHNENVYPVRTEIALPPSTNYQEIYINEITPRPLNVTQDKDGNWLAEYRLLPAQKLEITVSGVAQLSLTPKKQPITKEEFAEYTKEQPYWQTTNSSIKALASDLKTPKDIYEFVVKTLSYDFSRVTDDKSRLGATNSLKNPTSAVCREYTDLFIALTRSAGIPAREVDGFAYTENTKQRPLSLTKDILHAWPEYYDKDTETWVMVDPTWGSTTGGVDYFDVLDFDHFAFVIKGQNSDYPIPAGGYKFVEGKDIKDVRVSFATSLPIDQKNATFTSSFPKTSIAGLPITGKITLKNTGSKKISPQTLTITSSNLLPVSQSLTSNTVPPFGYQTWDLSFNPTSFLTKTNASFTIQFAAGSELGDKMAQKTLSIAPFYMTPVGIGGIILGILTITILIAAFKIRRLRLFK